MNSLGRIFRMSMLGESHGAGVGVVIDGCPAGVDLIPEHFNEDLARRRSGAKGTTPRQEADVPQLMSGVFQGKTTGAPLFVWFQNEDVNSKSYEKLRTTPRPGHADFTGFQKYGGFNDFRGGGHFSGRLTVAVVAAGVIAKKVLAPIQVNAQLLEVAGSKDFNSAIDAALAEGDSVGGIVECRVQALPVGLGEPFFDSVESLLSHAVFSIPAVKGIEFGAGFMAAKMRGSECNDVLLDDRGATATNHAGGINGGITNGNELVFRVAIKPTSSIKKTQTSINLDTGKSEDFSVSGRHDACIALRVPPVLEAMTACVLADLLLLEQKIPRVR